MRQRRRIGVVIGAIAATMLIPAVAHAATITVNSTADTTGDNSICTLRDAITSADNDTATGGCTAGSGTDTINFSAAFDGTVANSTIAMDTSTPVFVTKPVSIDGGDCGASGSHKPCVGVNVTGGSFAPFDIETANANGTSIKGVAVTNSAGAGVISVGTSNVTVTNSWFGVKLNGTTLGANDDGVALNNSSGGTVGGTTAAARNVFADNTGAAVALGNTGGNNLIEGNYIGTLPTGTVSSTPGGIGVQIVGPNNGNTIGGSQTTAGQCDGACNLIVGLSGNGVESVNAGGGASTTSIYGNFIGLGLNGTSNKGNGGSGINLDSAAGTTIGDPNVNAKRNYIAGNGNSGIRAVSSDGIAVDNNYIGLSADGTASIPNTMATPPGSGIFSTGSNGSYIGNRLGGNGMRIGAFTNSNNTIQGNVIGVGPSGEDLALNAAESGIELDGASNTIGGTTAGQGNTIGNVTVAGDGGLTGNAGIFLSSGASGTIQGNFIGTMPDGTPEPNSGWGILLGGSNGFTSDTIGGTTQASENVVSNSGHDAISFHQGGSGVRVLRNVGKNNGSGSTDLFFDLVGTDGPGNPSSFTNNGIVAPDSLVATNTSLSGHARTDATINVYESYTNRGDNREFLGTTTADHVTGNWTVNFPFSIPDGQCVTANQTDTSNNSSEFSPGIPPGGASPCLHPPISTITSGPANGSTIANASPSFGFSSIEAGATFQCRIQSSNIFTACSSPFNPGPLADGSYTFSERAIQSNATDPNLNAGLGTDLGASNTRAFTVDTTGPTITFTSGPADGSSSTGTSASFGFSATEPATFVCSLDGATFASCSSPFTVSSLGVGSHTVQVRGTDAVGNIGPIASRSFTVTSPPSPPPAKKCKKSKKHHASAAKKKKCKK
jgi:CSLREA domain-containing protein